VHAGRPAARASRRTRLGESRRPRRSSSRWMRSIPYRPSCSASISITAAINSSSSTARDDRSRFTQA
jgi:hypothetical protein